MLAIFDSHFPFKTRSPTPEFSTLATHSSLVIGEAFSPFLSGKLTWQCWSLPGRAVFFTRRGRQLLEGALRVHSCGRRLGRGGVLRRLKVRAHEVLLLTVLDLSSLKLVKLVVQAATLDRWDLVLGVGATDLVSPLHLLRSNDQSTDLLFAILRGCEADNEVRSIFAIGFQLAILGIDGKLTRAVLGEFGLELSELFHVVGQAERHGAGLVQGGLNRNDVVHFRLKCLEDSIELPSATRALVDDELHLSLERSERLESQVKQDGLIWRRD
mmetsp:Transcript_27918/g.34680  ORF Transcript_27918/g.34680 Transcript_27918/m.34680 type:complete len:270 (+) Transcript_27918:87-896(+)